MHRRHKSGRNSMYKLAQPRTGWAQFSLTGGISGGRPLVAENPGVPFTLDSGESKPIDQLRYLCVRRAPWRSGTGPPRAAFRFDHPARQGARAAAPGRLTTSDGGKGQRRQNRVYPSFCEAALHVKPHLIPPAIGLRTAILREVVHPSVRAFGGEARSPAHGGVRWAGALSMARLSTEAKDFDSRSPAFRILWRFVVISPLADDDGWSMSRDQAT